MHTEPTAKFLQATHGQLSGPGSSHSQESTLAPDSPHSTPDGSHRSYRCSSTASRANYTSSVYPHWFGRSVRRHAPQAKAPHRVRPYELYASGPRTAAKAQTAASSSSSSSPTPVLPVPVLLDRQEDRGEEPRRRARWPDMSDKENKNLPDIDKKILMAKWERDVFRVKLEELDRDMSMGFARWLFPDVGREA